MTSMIGKDEKETAITEEACEGEEDRIKQIQVEREAETSGGDGKIDGEWFTRPDHPLKNDLILGIFFQNVRVKKDLKTCRAVCKFWNEFAIPFVRSNFKVTIDGNQNQVENDNSGTRGVDQFVQVFSQNSIGIPFEKFQLGAFGTSDGPGKEFLNLCGDKIKDIDFKYIEFGNEVYHTIEDLAEVLKSSPNLETLTLRGHISSKSGDVVKLFTENSKPTLPNLTKLNMCNMMISFPKIKSSPIYKKCCPTFIEELLDMAPNISQIFAPDRSHGTEEFDFSLKDVLIAIGNLGRESSIQSLACDIVTKEDMETLLTMAQKPNRMNLKKLYVSSAAVLFDVELNELGIQSITYFKNSLEYLDLVNTCFDSFFQFPTMPRLKSLGIFIKDFDSRGIDLNKMFPSLEGLTLLCWDTAATFEEFLPESEPCLTLKNFRIFSSFNMSLIAFNQMLRVFPKLTSLKLSIQEPHGIEILRRIWSNMQELESLNVVFFHPMTEIESLDSVFTGITFQTLHEIKDMVSTQTLQQMSAQLRRETISNMKNQYCHLPSIGNLTSLRILELSVYTEGVGNGTDLTDLTAYFGLYLMPGLEYVEVHGCKFTEAGLDILKADRGQKYMMRD